MDSQFRIEDGVLLGYTGNDAVVEIPSSVKVLGYLTKRYNQIEKVIIPESVIEIRDEALMQMYSLSELYIPKSVQKIGQNICGRDYALASIVVDPENQYYSSMGANCIIEKATNTLIQGCLATVIPDTVVALAPRCFWKHHRLKKITIPSSVTTINKEALFGTNIKSLNLSKNVSYINPSAFLGNSELNEITIDKENRTYGDFDANAIVLKESNTLLLAGSGGIVPNGIENIGLISDEDSDEPIECIPFYNCREVESISISKSVKYIHWRSMEICSELKEIQFDGSETEAISLLSKLTPITSGQVKIKIK